MSKISVNEARRAADILKRMPRDEVLKIQARIKSGLMSSEGVRALDAWEQQEKIESIRIRGNVRTRILQILTPVLIFGVLVAPKLTKLKQVGDIKTTKELSSQMPQSSAAESEITDYQFPTENALTKSSYLEPVQESKDNPLNKIYLEKMTIKELFSNPVHKLNIRFSIIVGDIANCKTPAAALDYLYILENLIRYGDLDISNAEDSESPLEPEVQDYLIGKIDNFKKEIEDFQQELRWYEESEDNISPEDAEDFANVLNASAANELRLSMKTLNNRVVSYTLDDPERAFVESQEAEDVDKEDAEDF